MSDTESASSIAARYDLMDRTVVVTGGLSGIGLAVVRALAIADASVVVGVPDPVAVEPQVERLRREAEGSVIRVSHLDLADLRSVRRFVLAFHGTARPLSVLVNLAVPYPTAQRASTRDGFERNLGISHLGHFALSTGLVGALRRASGARVVNLTNAAHTLSDVDPADLGLNRRAYHPWLAYGQARSAAGLFTSGFHQHFAADGITCNVVNVGGISAADYRDASPAAVRAQGWAGIDGIITPSGTADQLAADVLWACVAGELDGVGGACVQDRRVVEPWPQVDDLALDDGPGYLARLLDPQLALDLWDASARMTRLGSSR